MRPQVWVRRHICPLTARFIPDHVKRLVGFLCSLAPLAAPLLGNEGLLSRQGRENESSQVKAEPLENWRLGSATQDVEVRALTASTLPCGPALACTL